MDNIDNNEGFDLTFLDKLIKNYSSQLLKNGDEKIKLGDLLKMIELRRKLSPENSEQKKFWKMLNKVRKENLQNNDNVQNKSNTNEK